jgi:hypothetical protein
LEVVVKKIVLFASLAVMAISSAAPALTEGNPRAVTVSGYPAGTVKYSYRVNIDGPTGACAYTQLWETPLRVTQPALCVVRELKMLYQTSCLQNRLANITTSVISVPTCWGFTQYGIPSQVKLVLAESGAAPTLRGIAVFAFSPFLPQAITIE